MTATLTRYQTATLTTNWTAFSGLAWDEGETLRIFVVTANQRTVGPAINTSGWEVFSTDEVPVATAARASIFYTRDTTVTAAEVTVGSNARWAGYLIRCYGPNTFSHIGTTNPTTGTAASLTIPTGYIPDPVDATWVAMGFAVSNALTPSLSGYTMGDGVSITGINAFAGYKDTTSVDNDAPGSFTPATAGYLYGCVFGLWEQEESEFYYHENKGSAISLGTGNTLYRKASNVVFPAEANQDYLILSYSELGSNSTSADALLKMTVDEEDLLSANVEPRTINIYNSHVMMTKWTCGASDKLVSAITSIKNESTNTATTRVTRTLVLKMGASWQFNQTSDDLVNSGGTMVDAVEVTATFAAGDYFIAAGGLSNVNSTTGPAYFTVNVDGDTPEETAALAGDGTNYMPVMLYRRVTLTAGSHTIKLRYRGHTGVTATLRKASLAVIPVSFFEAAYEEVATADIEIFSIGTVMTMTETVSAGKHIIFSWYPTSTFSSSAIVTVTVGDGTTVAESNQRTYNTDVERSQNGAMFAIRNYSAGSKTFDMTAASNSSLLVENGSGLYVMQLPEGITPPDPEYVYKGARAFNVLYLGTRTEAELYLGAGDFIA